MHPNNEILLSIVIPTLNRPSLLKETVSILILTIEKHNAKSRHKVELIIGDNASDAPEMKDGSTFKWIQDQGKVIAPQTIRFDNRVEIDESFQRTAKLANGKYVWVFGDDDFPLYGAVDALVDFLEDHLGTRLVHFATLVAKPNMRSGSFVLLGDMHTPILMDGRELLHHSMLRPGFISSFVCEKELWDQEFDFVSFSGYGFFAMIYSQIMESKVAYLPQPCVMMRQSDAAWKPNWGKYLFSTMPRVLEYLASDRAESSILISRYQAWYCGGFGYIHNLINCKSYGLLSSPDIKSAIERYQSRKNVLLFKFVNTLLPQFVARKIARAQQNRKFKKR